MGFLFGDEGSAFSIARDALALLMAAEDDDDRSLRGETHAACILCNGLASPS